jgi:hypothetical protein
MNCTFVVSVGSFYFHKSLMQYSLRRHLLCSLLEIVPVGDAVQLASNSALQILRHVRTRHSMYTVNQITVGSLVFDRLLIDFQPGNQLFINCFELVVCQVIS